MSQPASNDFRQPVMIDQTKNYGAIPSSQASAQPIGISSIQSAADAGIKLDPATMAFAMQLFAGAAVSSQSSLILPEGTYVGMVQNGQPHGKGALTYNSSNVQERKKYEGDFFNGEVHGKGIMTWLNGQRYEGEWEHNSMQGMGKLISSDGVVYEGQFVNGNVEGRGTRVSPSGQRYEGQFKDGQFNGHGKLTFPNGDVYSGEFVDDQAHGQGTLSHSDGSSRTGIFQKGTFMNGTLIDTYGDRYTYVDGKRENPPCGGCIIL